MPPRPHHGRKLLVASIGVATLNYVGVNCGSSASSGNLAPPPYDAGAEATGDAQVEAATEASGDVTNEAAADAATDAATGDAGAGDASRDAIDDLPVANLAVP
jgi:hypothetical protein